ncbi:MAG TPA: hypothetical protein VGO53_12965 [Steroidobacteraceae bacterium]|nr:hypothetical protein [Steroidobacteraceae bacterium]
MNSGTFKRMGVAGAVAATMALALTQSAAADAHGSASLVGTWRVQVTTYNCTTGVENPAFPAYLTFGVDGTLVETTANPGFVAGQRSPGHGYWERTGHNSWRAVSEAFLLFSSTAHGPFPGFAQGLQRLEQSVEFTGRDRISSEATTEFLNAAGAVVLTGCARAVGTRFE